MNDAVPPEAYEIAETTVQLAADRLLVVAMDDSGGVGRVGGGSSLLARLVVNAVWPLAVAEGRRQAAQEIKDGIERLKPSPKRFWDTADAARVYALADAVKVAAQIADGVS